MLESHINEIIHYKLFCVQVPSLSKDLLNSSTLLHVPVVHYFLLLISFTLYVWINTLFIHSSLDGHLACFPCLVRMDKAAMNILAPACYVDICFHFSCVSTWRWNSWVKAFPLLTFYYEKFQAYAKIRSLL